MYYSTWEKFGKHKRDLLRDNVEAAKEEQTEAQQQFKDTLTRIKELSNFDGGKLEKAYNALKDDYDTAVEKADDVKDRVEEIEDISDDLFEEWEAETQLISNGKMKTNSQRKLKITKQKYSQLHSSLKKSAKRMDQVLAKFQDHVLYLKHNLNAQAIGGLESEAVNIENDVKKLIADMQSSIREADAFIQTLPE